MSELGDVGLPDLLYLLGLRRRAENPTITANDEEVEPYLEDGQPVRVRSDTEVLAAVTLASGAASLTELVEWIAMVEPSLWRTEIPQRDRRLLVAGKSPCPNDDRTRDLARLRSDADERDRGAGSA